MLQMFGIRNVVWEQVVDMSFHDQIIQMPNVESYARMIVITCQKK